VTVQPTEDSSRYKLSLLDAVLAETIEFLRAQGIPLVLMIVPSPIDACVGYDWQVDIAKYPNYDRRILSDAVAETSRRLDALYVNLFDSFAGSDCNDLYFSPRQQPLE